jgi:hypothetical protein
MSRAQNQGKNKNKNKKLFSISMFISRVSNPNPLKNACDGK